MKLVKIFRKHIRSKALLLALLFLVCARPTVELNRDSAAGHTDHDSYKSFLAITTVHYTVTLSERLSQPVVTLKKFLDHHLFFGHPYFIVKKVLGCTPATLISSVNHPSVLLLICILRI